MNQPRIKDIHNALSSDNHVEALNIARQYLRHKGPKPPALQDYVHTLELQLSIKISEETYAEDTMLKALTILSKNESHDLSASQLAQHYINKNFFQFVASRLRSGDTHSPAYEPYLSYTKDRQTTKREADCIVLPKAKDPRISILLPIYKVKPEYLANTILSVLRQQYPRWELCIYFSDLDNLANEILVDQFQQLDKRINVIKGGNLGISGNSNLCLSQATGEFIALLDHDDDLSDDALACAIECIRSYPKAEFIYTDKDSMLENGRDLVNPLFKPDWSPEMLYSANYLTHLNFIRRESALAVGGFDSQTDGAQDWDLFFKVTENTGEIYSIKNVCYHWRIHPNSTSVGLEAKPYAHNGQLVAINNHLQRKFGAIVSAAPNEHGGFRLEYGKDQSISGSVICVIYGPTNRTSMVHKSLLNQAENGRLCHYQFIQITSASAGEVMEKVCSLLVNPESSPDESVVLIDSRMEKVSIHDIDEIAQWTSFHPSIGFCSGIILNQQNKILECGVCFDSTGQPFSPFASKDLHDYGIYGSPLWYRNWTACNGFFLALKSGPSVRSMIHEFIDTLADKITNPCLRLTFLLSSRGLRGMTNPHAILICKDDEYMHDFHSIKNEDLIFKLERDPYFHSQLSADSRLLPTPAPVNGPSVESATKAEPPFGKYFSDALVLSEVIDITPAEIINNVQNPAALNQMIQHRKAAWFLPDFETAFYGGVMTILRLANHLSDRDLIHNTFIICGDVDVNKKRELIIAAFPSLATSSFMKLSGNNFLQRIPEADYGIATLWTTAYILAATDRCACKFYMIQDYEPYFYPAGSTFAQSELTYNFGFYAIANTQSLADIYTHQYGGKSVCLVPAIDTSIFYPGPELDYVLPFRIFYYARPATPRNCFEIACAAFKRLKQIHGTAIQIVCAGSGWDPVDYNLQDAVLSLGMLPYEETADLYRTCHVGLSMMMTKHPSYLPLEMMACGTIVLANQNDANSWLLQDHYNCLTFMPTKSCLVEKISYALENYKSLTEIRRNGIETIRTNHSSWEDSLQKVASFMHTAGGSRSPNQMENELPLQV